MVQCGGYLSICDRVGISLTMVILPRRSLYVSGILLLEAWGRKHRLALTVASRQDRRCWIGWVRRVWIEL